MISFRFVLRQSIGGGREFVWFSSCSLHMWRVFRLWDNNWGFRGCLRHQQIHLLKLVNTQSDRTFSWRISITVIEIVFFSKHTIQMIIFAQRMIDFARKLHNYEARTSSTGKRWSPASTHDKTYEFIARHNGLLPATNGFVSVWWFSSLACCASITDKRKKATRSDADPPVATGLYRCSALQNSYFSTPYVC